MNMAIVSGKISKGLSDSVVYINNQEVLIIIRNYKYIRLISFCCDCFAFYS